MRAKKVRSRLPVLLAVTILITAGAASATTLLDYSLQEKVAKALAKTAEHGAKGAGIVQARVIEKWVEPGPRGVMPYTYVRLKIEKNIAGADDLPQEIIIRQYGGELDGKVVKVHGQASFADHERTLLFLEKSKFGLNIIGMSQGKYSIKTDPVTGEDYAVTSYDRRTMFVSKDRKNHTYRKKDERSPLDRLVLEIKTIARELSGGDEP